MTENQLTPKEQYEKAHEAKRRERDGQSVPTSPASGRRWWPWFLVLVLLAGTVFGLYKLATIAPPGGVVVAGKLSDPLTPADWTDGNPAAKAQLVEFSDFQCPACGFYAPWVKQLRTEFKDKLGVTYRHFPLRSIHPNAQLAAQVAEAAGLQGKFWAMADILFDKQSIWSEQITPRDTLFDLAKTVGVNLVKLKTDLDSDLVKNKIEANYQSGIRSGVQGTPTFYLNGKQITNPRTYEDFRALIIAATKG